MTRRSKTDQAQDVAARAWRYLFDFFIATSVHRSNVLEQLTLTPNDSKALTTLAVEPGEPMRALARKWGTDPSNATWVVDRLERRGLAERRPDPRDRRVKLVALTPKGQEVKRTLLEAFYEPPPEVQSLDEADLQALIAIFEKVASRRSPPEPPRRVP